MPATCRSPHPTLSSLNDHHSHLTNEKIGFQAIQLVQDYLRRYTGEPQISITEASFLPHRPLYNVFSKDLQKPSGYISLLSSYSILALCVFIKIMSTFPSSFKIMINFNSTDIVYDSKDMGKKRVASFISCFCSCSSFWGDHLFLSDKQTPPYLSRPKHRYAIM